MPDAYEIRQATSDDAAGILRCLREAFEPYRGRYSIEGFRDTTLDGESVYTRLCEMHVLVAAAASGEVIGTVGGSATGEVAHLRGMCVLPQWSSSGVAQALLDAIEAELRSWGCTRVTLDTTEPLQRAMRFYERNEYHRTGHVSDFYGMPLIEYAKDL